MSRNARRCLFGTGFLILTLVALAVFDPNRILVGVVQGDDFYKWRPTRYWREILKRDGLAGSVGSETIAIFNHPAAIPVLRACAQDGDRHVRWPAILLLGHVARGNSHIALPALREALTDEDAEVRLQAIVALHVLRGNAVSAGPDLVARLNDPEAQVRLWAEKALWDVNKSLAVKAGNWRTFESPRWHFAVAFPLAPVEEEKPNFIREELTTHSFTALHGTSSLTVAVTEYPPELLKGTDDERLDALRNVLPVVLNARLVDERPFQLGTIHGREFTFESTPEKDGTQLTIILKSRVFWVQRLHFQVTATYSTEFSVLPAAEYFLDSFEYRSASKKS